MGIHELSCLIFICLSPCIHSLYPCTVILFLLAFNMSESVFLSSLEPPPPLEKSNGPSNVVG